VAQAGALQQAQVELKWRTGFTSTNLYFRIIFQLTWNNMQLGVDTVWLLW
jgi:hypothetical protein